MHKSLLLKIMMIAVLMAVIVIPLMMIEGTISERMAYHDQAVRGVAADSVREQTIIGPLLVLPYVDEYEAPVPIPNDKLGRTRIQKFAAERRLLVFPNDLHIVGKIETERRYRGIHQVLVYTGQHGFSGDFVLPAMTAFARQQPDSRLTVGQPFVAVSIEDVRGIHNTPSITWGGRPIEFEQGAGLLAFKSGLHASLAATDFVPSARVKFSFDLVLDGIERINIAPVGKNNHVNLSSNWPHPQFGGRFLPSAKQRSIDEHGFKVMWDISSLASHAQSELNFLERPAKAGTPGEAGGDRSGGPQVEHFSVAFIEPINVYSQAERATKYGLLFVALTFAIFFIFEMLKRLPIHPIQYLLVGLALVLFFLLLVGLSEHIAFWQAYLIASTACIVLIGFYLSHVLRDRRRGFGFGVALTVLYGALYGLLSSESNALVLGSGLLFAVLAAIMVATRKVDWYQVGSPNSPQPA
ncbi:MAG: cell envelope integrity protein CreD [Pseudomonadota bacterium]